MPDLTVFGGLVTQRLDLLAKLRRIELPLVIVHGERDTVAPPDMARQLYEAAKGPKRPVLVEDAGHSWVLRRASGRVFEALRELVAAAR